MKINNMSLLILNLKPDSPSVVILLSFLFNVSFHTSIMLYLVYYELIFHFRLPRVFPNLVFSIERFKISGY